MISDTVILLIVPPLAIISTIFINGLISLFNLVAISTAIDSLELIIFLLFLYYCLVVKIICDGMVIT